VQGCVEKCDRENRKSITGDDLLWTLTQSPEFCHYSIFVREYVHKYRTIEATSRLAKREDNPLAASGTFLVPTATMPTSLQQYKKKKTTKVTDLSNKPSCVSVFAPSVFLASDIQESSANAHNRGLHHAQHQDCKANIVLVTEAVTDAACSVQRNNCASLHPHWDNSTCTHTTVTPSTAPPPPPPTPAQPHSANPRATFIQHPHTDNDHLLAFCPIPMTRHRLTRSPSADVTMAHVKSPSMWSPIPFHPAHQHHQLQPSQHMSTDNGPAETALLLADTARWEVASSLWDDGWASHPAHLDLPLPLAPYTVTAFGISPSSPFSSSRKRGRGGEEVEMSPSKRYIVSKRSRKLLDFPNPAAADAS